MKELVVHIGPPKTATTLIQEACKRSRSDFAKQGLTYELRDGLSAHHVLASYLLGLDVVSSHVGWHSLDRSEARFPLSVRERHLISSENLYRVGDLGVAALMDWAQPETVTVVAAFREPVKWLWSWWQQTCKWPVWEPWPSFVARAFETREFFPSMYLSPWTRLEVPTKVILLDLASDTDVNPARTFAESLGLALSSDALEFSERSRVNDSMTVGETLMTALLVREVVRDLTERQRGVWGEVSPGLLGRVCLDLVDRSHPMYEMGRTLEVVSLEQSVSPLDQSTLPAVAAYRESWWRDLQEMIETSGLATTVYPSGSAPLPGAVPDWDGFALPMGAGFPKSDFDEHIEMPAEFFALARLLAASIGKLHKAGTFSTEKPN